MEAAVLGLVGVVIGTALGGWIGSRNQVKAEVREKRRDMYLEWLLWLDRLPIRQGQAAESGLIQQHLMEFHAELGDITSQVDMYASAEVTRAWRRLQDRLASRELSMELLRAVANPGADDLGRPSLALLRTWHVALDADRQAWLQAMRRDIGTWRRSFGRTAR